MTNVIPYTGSKKLPTEGEAEAKGLAFACFVEGLTNVRFGRMSIEDQVAFAADNAGLDVPGLQRALRYFGAYYHAHAEQMTRELAARARK